MAKAGGVAGLAKALGSDPHNGLDPAATGDNSIAAHAAAFGENKFPDRPPKVKSFVGLVLCVRGATKGPPRTNMPFAGANPAFSLPSQNFFGLVRRRGNMGSRKGCNHA